jgi:hypothetical protein
MKPGAFKLYEATGLNLHSPYRGGGGVARLRGVLRLNGSPGQHFQPHAEPALKRGLSTPGCQFDYIDADSRASEDMDHTTRCHQLSVF